MVLGSVDGAPPSKKRRTESQSEEEEDLKDIHTADGRSVLQQVSMNIASMKGLPLSSP